MRSLLFVALIASTLAFTFAGLNCECTCSDGKRFTVYNAVDANTCYTKTTICRYGSFIKGAVCSYSNPPATTIYNPQPSKTVYLPQPTATTIYNTQPNRTVYMPQPTATTIYASKPTQTVYYPPAYPQPTRFVDDDTVVADDFLSNLYVESTD